PDRVPGGGAAPGQQVLVDLRVEGRGGGVRGGVALLQQIEHHRDRQRDQAEETEVDDDEERDVCRVVEDHEDERRQHPQGEERGQREDRREDRIQPLPQEIERDEQREPGDRQRELVQVAADVAGEERRHRQEREDEQ